jgi:outer membrane protein assembly factor BamB
MQPVRRTGLAFVLALCVASFPAAAHSNVSMRANVPSKWLSYGHDPQLTNFVRMPDLSWASARRMQVAWQTGLDGPIVASPLYYRGTLIVETEGGSIYALRLGDGAMLWKRTFGVVSTEACGSWGFSSTGAIDPKLGVLYAIGADGYLHALSVDNGRERKGWPIPITAAHADGEYVWGGLRLLGRKLYVPVASYCDVPGSDGHLANGRLVAVDVQRRETVAIFDPVRGDGNLGGIWGWGGVSVDPTGRKLFTGTGNSHVWDATCSCYVDTAGLADAMVELTPGLRVIAWNRPKPYTPTGDFDFGSTPLLFRPSGCPPLLAGNSKLGWLQVWNRNRLARGPIYHVQVSDGIAPFVGAPSYSSRLHMIFESHATLVQDDKKVGDGIAAFSVNAQCRFHRRWITSIGVGEEPAPVVIGNVLFAAGGDAGGFAALDARTGKSLWRLATVDATISPPIAAGGLILAGDYGGTLHAFAPRP